MPAYGARGGMICKFWAEKDRDRWVEMAPEVREAEVNRDEVLRVEGLVDASLASWRRVEDPDLNIRYRVADLVVPAPVAGLPMGQARAYWLCDHEKGPKLDQYRAAELLDTTQGSVSNHLRRAREKLDRD